MASDGKNPADAPTGSGSGSDGKQQKTRTKDVQKVLDSLSPQQLSELIALNPSLARDVAQASGTPNPTVDQAAAQLRRMWLEDLAAEQAGGGGGSGSGNVKGAKDMAAYRFWATQPVPRFGDGEGGEGGEMEDGPLRIQTVDDVSAEPAALVGGFEWVTMDLTSDDEIKEVYELLNGHYVEDDNSTFRFNYSPSILRWAMMAPGWDKRYHVGVRATQSRKLVAFISAIPVRVRVREKEIVCSEVNFLCVHKKLRGKRLAPVLIREVTRISNLEGVWQGLYTAGVVLPRPVSTCQYYHRPLRWQKLYECGFSYLPRGSKPALQTRRYALPETTSTPGWRAMEPRDVKAVTELQHRYSRRFDIAPHLSSEEVAHWLLAPTPASDGNGGGGGGGGSGERVVWTFVAEVEGVVTDFISFYCVESSVISNTRHSTLRVAYLFYYATEAGLSGEQVEDGKGKGKEKDRDALKTRLNQLVGDALVEAKRAGFDVFNALTLMDNGLFLEQQKFARGDGQLHYYLFNYRTRAIAGGMDDKGQLEAEKLSGIGLVLP